MKSIIIFILIFVSNNIYSQDLQRDIILKDIRMNGSDILILQKQLNDLGFNEIGESDGYYGPLTESVIKNIQYFSGFKKDGIVEKKLWNYIFSNENKTILKNISIISKYNLNDFRKILEDRNGYSSEGGEIEKYIFENNIKHIILHIYGETSQVCYYFYYVNDNYYFIIEENYKYPFPIYYTWLDRKNMNNDELERYAYELSIIEKNEFWIKTEIEYKTFINIDNNLYQLINGIFSKTDLDLEYLTKVINNEKNK